jgi:Ser/Thr protein kinase RdoA (MazF antagonist)
MQRLIQEDALAAWCARWLGAQPTGVLFEVAHLSSVTGLRLADGREVVVKARPPAARLHACVHVQRHLRTAGFPCPAPLAGPYPLGMLTATAEAFVPGGTRLEPGADSPRLYAEALAELIHLAPPVASISTLAPPPAWVCWDHDRPGTWPLPDDRDDDLNRYPEPAWLEEVGRRVRRRLAQCRQPPVLGHADWEEPNLRWLARRLHVVHDWDSVVSRPEAAIAGVAAAVCPAFGGPGTATLEESEAFLQAYEQVRGQPWSVDEWQVCWAAGLWIRAYNTKKATLEGDGGAMLERLASEAPERLRLACA